MTRYRICPRRLKRLRQPPLARRQKCRPVSRRGRRRADLPPMRVLLANTETFRTWISTRLSTLRTSRDVQAYLTEALCDPKPAAGSVVLAFSVASSFERRRRLADAVLTSEVAFSGWLSEPAVCVDIARMCYHACWRQLRPAWPLFEELADRMPQLVIDAREALEF